jgi:hypothetical protein
MLGLALALTIGCVPFLRQEDKLPPVVEKKNARPILATDVNPENADAKANALRAEILGDRPSPASPPDQKSPPETSRPQTSSVDD